MVETREQNLDMKWLTLDPLLVAEVGRKALNSDRNLVGKMKNILETS